VLTGRPQSTTIVIEPNVVSLTTVKSCGPSITTEVDCYDA